MNRTLKSVLMWLFVALYICTMAYAVYHIFQQEFEDEAACRAAGGNYVKDRVCYNLVRIQHNTKGNS